MNKAFLIGNLTRDPELTQTTNGIAVCRFSIAVQRRFSNAEGEREADFFNIITWRGQADICAKYLKKGSKCGIIGSLQNRSYEAQDGTKRYVTEITADEVEFLSSRTGGEEVTKKEEVTKLEPIDDDSLPF